MGMSGDYDLAIAAGAHVVRVGSALYEGLPEARPSHEGPSDAATSDPARDERHAPEGGADGRTTSGSEDEA